MNKVERPDVFTARIGNLLPGKEALVRITYVAELGLEGDDLRFVLPTTVSPRYAPAEDRKGIGRSPAEAVNPPVAWEVPYGLELTVRLEMPSAIRGLESPSHPLAIEIDGASATVRLGERRTSLDRDFVLLVKLQEPHEPRAWVEERNGETVAMVAFQPRFESRESASEVIFVVDRSGSMGGTSIAEARNALPLCLRSLREGSWFNVVGFGSTHAVLFPESRPYGEETLLQATEHVSSLDANLGGTEILPALEAVFAGRRASDLPRQLIVMTDGQVTNTEAVMALVRKHSETTRVFTLGIGAGASHDLVRGMARAGEGEAELIYPGERIESKVLRQLSRALAPALTDVRVNWGGLAVKQAPNRVPAVFAGGRVLVYGFLERPFEREVEVKLEAKGAEGSLSFSVPLSPAKRRTGFLSAVLGVRLRKLRKKLEGATGDPDEAARAWATALALAWLESNASESRDEWELLAGKAKVWLSRCGARLAGGEEWLAAAAPALTTRWFWP
jgi:Ca-activated chloride channel family protein